MKKCVLLKNISLLQIYIAASKIKEKTLLRNQQLNCTKVIRTEERSELTTNRVVIFFSSSGSGDGGGGGGGQVTAITGATHIETLINPCQQGERKSGRGVFQSSLPPPPLHPSARQYFLNIARTAVGITAEVDWKRAVSAEFRGERPTARRVESRRGDSRSRIRRNGVKWDNPARHKWRPGISIFAGAYNQMKKSRPTIYRLHIRANRILRAIAHSSLSPIVSP